MEDYYWCIYFMNLGHALQRCLSPPDARTNGAKTSCLIIRQKLKVWTLIYLHLLLFFWSLQEAACLSNVFTEASSLPLFQPKVDYHMIEEKVDIRAAVFNRFESWPQFNMRWYLWPLGFTFLFIFKIKENKIPHISIKSLTKQRGEKQPCFIWTFNLQNLKKNDSTFLSFCFCVKNFLGLYEPDSVNQAEKLFTLQKLKFKQEFVSYVQ